MKKSLPFIILCLFILIFPLGIHKIYATYSPPPKVAILDTSIDLDHPDLKGHIVGGYNFVTNSPLHSVQDPLSFHGTHIAGIICGTPYNQGSYPNAHLLYYVVDAPHQTMYHENVTKAIYRALQEGAKVINFSGKLSSNLMDTHILQAITYARSNGVIFVKSCGNNGPSLWTIGDLATSDQVISVGAYDTENNTLYPLSSRGPAFGSLKIKPDLVAPGVSIISSAPFSQGNYIEASGTSMASAYVSGALGLLTAQRTDLSTELLLGALLNNATPLEESNGRTYSVLAQGSGAINLSAALSTDMVCLPTQLSFSTIAPIVSEKFLTTSLVIKNTSSSPITYKLAFYSEEDTPPFEATFPPNISLLPHEEKTLPFTLRINKDASPNHYGGRLYFSNGDSVKNLPFLLEIPSDGFPIVRGFSLSNKIVSFANSKDFSFILESALPNTLSLSATRIDTGMTYPLLLDKRLLPGINEIGWDGYDLNSNRLPDGLYEIKCTATSSDLTTSMGDLMLLIDNTAPAFRKIVVSEDTTEARFTVTLDDLMIPYNYVVDIVYREYETLPPPLSLSYSFDNKEYFPFYLEAAQDTLSFTVPNGYQKIFLKARDLSGNTSIKCVALQSPKF